MRKLSTISRVAVIGNCQAAALARCVRSANPALDVMLVSLGARKNTEAPAEVLRNLESCHAILMQPGGHDWLRSMNFTNTPENVTLYPRLTFYGFHPDFLQLRGRNGRPVRSACGTYHSRIVLAGFCMGLPESRVERLFNSFVFGRLGYFDLFSAWKKLLLSRTAEIGYDLKDDFEAWMKPGAFMHTLNHPAIRVIASVARRAMEKAGIEQTHSPGEAGDPLARAAQLPVYPEIARAIGIEPICSFRVRDGERRGTRSISIPDFIGHSFRLYAGLDADILESAEIAAVRESLRGEIRV